MPSLASFAQYFRIGVEVGICTPEEVRDWAISVIDDMDEPPGEIIEVSWRWPIPVLITHLNDVEGEPDEDLVCRSLLGRVLEMLTPTNDDIAYAVLQAKRVAFAAGTGDLYYLFSCFEDRLSLAKSNIYGTLAECRQDFESELAEHSKPPLIYP